MYKLELLIVLIISSIRLVVETTLCFSVIEKELLETLVAAHWDPNLGKFAID